MTRNAVARPQSQATIQSLLSRSSSHTAERIRDSMLNGVRKGRKSFKPSKPTFQWIRGELIGKGSYGRVYLALNATTGDVMAVKQVELPHKATEATKQQKEVMEALKFEGATLSELDHPHIVRYLGYEENPDSLSIFLEYVPGGTIESCLRQHGAFSEGLTTSFTRQMLEGLEYLHARGIIHRDLKSANILVEQDGICKISDFGISKRADELDARAFTGMKGTVYWMAPEVVDPQKAGYDAKVDIWSIGCLVLEMLSGVRPWFGLEVVPVMLKLYQHKTPPPVPAHISLSATASAFLQSCFARDPTERPSAVQLMQHRYLLPSEDWVFTQSETQPKSKPTLSRHNTDKSLPTLPPSRRPTQRSARKPSISVAPPIDRGGQRHVLRRIESEDYISHRDTLLPGPPLVFITPPGTPVSSDIYTASPSEGVFNWAVSADSASSRAATPTQRKKNFYVMNPDSEETANTRRRRVEYEPPPLPPTEGSGPTSSTIRASDYPPPVASSSQDMTWSTDMTESEFGTGWQKAPMDMMLEDSPWHRPDLRNVYEHLEEFFPEHDIDKPIVNAPDTSSLFKSRNARRSIRMVTQEHLRRGLSRRGTRLWGGKMEEVIIH